VVSFFFALWRRSIKVENPMAGGVVEAVGEGEAWCTGIERWEV